MLPCEGCAYKRTIAGDAHYRCVFNWLKMPTEVPGNVRGGPRTMRWFNFPFNYDPVWGPDECPARSETEKREDVSPANPLADLLSLLGG